MSSFVKVNVKTTAPEGLTFELNGGVSSTSELTIPASLTFSDNTLTQYRIYGDIVNAEGEAITAENAEWKSISPDQLSAGKVETTVTLSSDEGTKNLTIEVKDDVGNVGTGTASVTYSVALPTVTITQQPSKTKISKVAPFNFFTFKFKAAQDCTEYKVCFVGSTSAAASEGVEIPVTGGSLNITGTDLVAETEVEVTVYTEDLLAASDNGDGEKIVKVFVKTEDDVWSA